MDFAISLTSVLFHQVVLVYYLIVWCVSSYDNYYFFTVAKIGFQNETDITFLEGSEPIVICVGFESQEFMDNAPISSQFFSTFEIQSKIVNGSGYGEIK